MSVPRHFPSLLACLFVSIASADEPVPVSYYKDIRPVFQAQCQGCHQPAKAKGGYVMTDFARLLEGGESVAKEGKKAILPRDPDHSLLIEQITPVNGEVEMPKKKPPLPPADLAFIRRWISEGALDDTPSNARQRYDAAHPPIYTRPATVTSLDYSPDGQFLAVTGFQEVLLYKADGSALVGRLVGLSQRLESVRFSPDGKWLAAVGGQPARMGEVQIWDVAKRQLALSVPVTFDTVYGVSWSPDSQTVAFGCSDKTLRAIQVTTGKQVLQLSTHSDWVLDTAFSLKGDHVISVSRDMSAKLTEFASERFVDNITSITPGALRGGIHAVARHPKRDEILIGGADGIPQAYRVFRTTARKIGDDASHLRQFPAMEGRIYSVAYSPDGSKVAAGSSLDGHGIIQICSADYDDKLPADIEKLLLRDVKSLVGPERTAMDQYLSAGVKLLYSIPVETGVYAVAFSPDGSTLAASGEDGRVRLIRLSDGALAKEFVPAPVGAAAVAALQPLSNP